MIDNRRCARPTFRRLLAKFRYRLDRDGRWRPPSAPASQNCPCHSSQQSRTSDSVAQSVVNVGEGARAARRRRLSPHIPDLPFLQGGFGEKIHVHRAPIGPEGNSTSACAVRRLRLLPQRSGCPQASLPGPRIPRTCPQWLATVGPVRREHCSVEAEQRGRTCPAARPGPSAQCLGAHGPRANSLHASSSRSSATPPPRITSHGTVCPTASSPSMTRPAPAQSNSRAPQSSRTRMRGGPVAGAPTPSTASSPMRIPRFQRLGHPLLQVLDINQHREPQALEKMVGKCLAPIQEASGENVSIEEIEQRTDQWHRDAPGPDRVRRCPHPDLPGRRPGLRRPHRPGHGGLESY